MNSTVNEILEMTNSKLTVLMSESGKLDEDVPGWDTIRVDDVFNDVSASLMDDLIEDGLTDREARRAIAQMTMKCVAAIADSAKPSILVVGSASHAWFAIEETVDALSELANVSRVAIFARGTIGHGGVKLLGRSQGGRIRCPIAAVVLILP